MKRRDFLKMAGMAALSLNNRMYSQAKIPNIVLILTDDQGWGDLRVHGNVNLETPNIDSLVGDGVPFGNVKRSATAPNSSYFTNWSSRGGLILRALEIPGRQVMDVRGIMLTLMKI